MTDPATDPPPIAAQPVQEPSLASLEPTLAPEPAPDPAMLLQAQIDGLISRLDTAEQESANLRTTTADLAQRAADASALLESGLDNTNPPMLHDLMTQAIALLAD